MLSHWSFKLSSLFKIFFFFFPALFWWVLLPGKSHGWRSLEGCGPWGRWRSDMTEWLHFHFSFSCIGEGNGTPLQCSCLENPMGGGAWWAAAYEVAQNRTRLKRLSSSSSTIPTGTHSFRGRLWFQILIVFTGIWHLWFLNAQVLAK